MGMSSGIAKVSELKSLLKWVEKNKTQADDNNMTVPYDKLVKEIKARIVAADWD